ncbi:MAG: MaoC family dehydratase [Candidatus Eremiobacteraeota bacterium]|nr:MaoC family dehydratase [Candidatus Eremiobacteraeota bacterium]
MLSDETRPFPTIFTSVADLERAAGDWTAESAWQTVTQALIDEFARVTGDHQWIHVDPERARRDSPLGTTIAHGFLTLSLLPSMIQQCISFPTARLSLNYGFDRVRFVAPVPAGSEIRGLFTLEEVRPVEDGAQLTWHVDIEMRGAAKPALSARWLTRVGFAEPPAAGAQRS